MKIYARFLFFLSFLLISMTVSAAPGQSQKPLQRVASNEELAAQQAANRKALEARKKTVVKPGDVVPRKRDRGSIIDRSTILSYGKTWTIVPNGSILHIPSFLSSRVSGERADRFVSWQDFYRANRGWIHLQNVKMRQARGREQLPQATIDSYPDIGRVVVAVCHGGPISVVPPKVEEEEKTAEAAGS